MSKITLTVTYKDGAAENFECEAFDDGSPKLHQIADELNGSLAEAANSGVLPEFIVDSNGKHYYVEWEPNVIPCPEVK